MAAPRLTDEQAKAFGLGDLIPKRASLAPVDGMNKLERRYSERLEDQKHRGIIKGYRFESIKFRLANRCWWLPDFFVEMPDGPDEVHECKGFWRDDARVKIKVAAEMYPHFRFLAVRWVARNWEFEHIWGRETS